jgi:Bifunctional DNA primase/polymerase, N-terminal.
MDNTSKALALARLGIKVFPVRVKGRLPAIKGGSGVYDATSDDFEKIATWFDLDYVGDQYTVGYWTGGSGLFVADLDRGKANGKDGFASVAKRGLDVGATHSYSTQSGGEHRVFATDRLDLSPSQDYDGIDGLDIRAGGSYAVWWGDEVPESRDAFSTDIPEWMLTKSEKTEFSGEGFSGTVEDWLNAIPDDPLPSGKVVEFMNRIPANDFGHHEMVDLAWAIVRLGAERETGVATALKKLRAEWLRDPYNTPEYHRDFDMALRGAINKAGRVQKPTPHIIPFVEAMRIAAAAGAGDDLKALERRVSETVNTGSSTEIDFARYRREMFKVAAQARLSPATALGIVSGSKAFKNSKAPISSVWYGDGEPIYHDIADEAADKDTERVTEQERIDREIELAHKVTSLSTDAESFTFLSPSEEAIANGYEWWGADYLAWVQTRLTHFNRPYHVGSMWAALSVIASPWGKVPLKGAKPTDCNLYLNILGDSTSGKSEAWMFGTGMIDTYYGVENSPIIADVKKASALSVHRTLILRDGKASLVYSDEVQSFFQDIKTNKWQGTIMGDLSDYYGGNVPPKNTMNDKEISGKRAKTILTTYLTGIADLSLDAISITNWRDGFFYRFLWGFGLPREEDNYEIEFETSVTSYTAQFEAWAREFKRVGALQEVKWGPGRIVQWTKEANLRLNMLNKQLADATRTDPLFDTVFVNSNRRFLISIMKCATLIALSEASEVVTLEHLLVAMTYAGPWHRSMVLAVRETGKEMFDREVERCLVWVKRNAVRQLARPAFINRSTVMRNFKPNEAADRLLRQLTEEGWLTRSGDIYELAPEGGA